MKTGNIILISGQSNQAKIIQKFQMKHDQESGIYNHSGIILRTLFDAYVVEQTQIEGSKIRASARIRPLSVYNQRQYKRLILEPINGIEQYHMERILFTYIGIRYDYWNLIHDQVIRTLTGKWTGRKRNAWKKMICHEFTMFCWNEYSQIFPEYYAGDVSDIYHSPHFKKL